MHITSLREKEVLPTNQFMKEARAASRWPADADVAREEELDVN